MSTRVILAPGACGREGATLLGQALPNPADLANPVVVPECLFWSDTSTLSLTVMKSDTPAQCDPQSALGVSPDHPNTTQDDPR